MEAYWKQNQDRFKLYPTENIYNFLQLDTKTGKIDVVQWSLDEEKEFSVTLNGEDLSLLDAVSGTFELYPTKNIYQFILLDKVTGRKWHVQWGFEASKRWIRKMYQSAYYADNSQFKYYCRTDNNHISKVSISQSMAI